MSEYRCKYEYSKRFGSPLHIWSVVGARGGIHLHITDNGEECDVRYSGGIEVHRRTPPPGCEWAPDQDKCWLLHAPCWRDGSSLVATKHWIPLWLADPMDHDRMFELLSREAAEQFLKDKR